MRRWGIAVVAVLVLTACSHTGQNPTAAAGTSPSTASETPTEGPAADGHRWRGGVTARVVSVVPAPADLGYGSPDPANGTGLLVTVEFTNDGDTALSWDDAESRPDEQLLYGENRYEADGYAYDQAPDLPTRLMPGTSAAWTMVHFLPSTGRDTLALTVTPRWGDPAYPPWTFTGVQLTG